MGESQAQGGRVGVMNVYPWGKLVATGKQTDRHRVPSAGEPGRKGKEHISEGKSVAWRGIEKKKIHNVPL